MRVLLVEDEIEKRRLIAEALLEVAGVTLDNLEFVDNAFSAKKLISQSRFDLLILDLNVPARPDQRANLVGGLEVLHFIKNNDKAIAPLYILGLTAYDESFAAASLDFAMPIWRLIKFSYAEVTWREPLKDALAYLIKIDQPPYRSDGKNFRTDLGIIVALEDEELASVLAIDAGWKDTSVQFDHTKYYTGSFTRAERTVNVAAVACPKMGLPTAAVIASKLISTFRPRYLAMTGICAGVRGKVEIGDILVADPCFDWGSGKWIRHPTTLELAFRPAPYPWRLDQELRSAAWSIGNRPDFLRKIYDEYTGPKPPKPPSVFIDAMASGGSVLQAEKLVEDVRDQHKNLIGVEMESYSVFSAAEYAAHPRPKCISIKAVCDYGDETKVDSFHTYAAAMSAKFLKELALEKLAGES